MKLFNNGLHSRGGLINKTPVRSKPRSLKTLRLAARCPLQISSVLLAVALSHTGPLQAQERPAALPGAPKFLGADSCSSSGCHGGAGDVRKQFIVWSKQDFHTRSYATLTTARSEVIAKALGLPNATTHAKCTSCHAPLHQVPSVQLTKGLDLKEGVSCESCHGPGERWLRSHTRPDLSHADRVHAGQRDLKNLYVRANSCVACHQTVEADLLTAGHPELIFELDGQAVTEPKHWREKGTWSGAQAWLVGQAVALREMSWQLARADSTAGKNAAKTKELSERWQGLLWLMQKTDGLDADLPSFKGVFLVAGTDNVTATQSLTDKFAMNAARLEWSNEMTARCLKQIAASHAEFRAQVQDKAVHARRAERLVLAVDRLVAALDKKSAGTALDADVARLFKLAQSVPDFDPAAFATALEQFSGKLNQLASR